MMHLSLLIFGFYWVAVGIALCSGLFIASIKTGKRIWLITVPGILIIGLLTIDFGCHMLHLPRHVIPYQAQIINAIHGTVQLAIIPMLLMKLYEQWSKKRAQAILHSQAVLPSE